MRCFLLPLRRPGLCPGLLACLLILFGAGACAAPAAAAPADVTAAVPRGAAEQALKAAASAYQQETGLRVEAAALGPEAYASQTAAVLLAGLDRYDLVLLPADSLALWAAYHVILPVEPPSDTSGLAPWLPPLEVDGQLYGLPAQPEAEVIWYRADLLASAGLPPPRTWAEFEQAALALNAPPERYGAAIAAGPLDAGSDFAAVLAGFGGALIGPGRRAQALSPAAVQALEWYSALRSKAGVVPPASGRFTRGDVIRQLREGRAALGIAPLSAASALQDCTASPAVCAGSTPLLAWTWLPGSADAGGVRAFGSLSAWAIPRGASHPGAAAAFAAWLSGEAGARAWAEGGGTPAHRTVLAGLNRPESALSRVSAFQTAFPPTPACSQLWKAAHTAAHSAAAGDQLPAQALREAQVQIEEALRKFSD